MLVNVSRSQPDALKAGAEDAVRTTGLEGAAGTACTDQGLHARNDQAAGNAEDNYSATD